MACDPIVDIPIFECGANSGGVMVVRAIPLEDVTTIPAAVGSTISTDLTLDPLSDGWRTLNHIGETGNFKSTRQGELDGGSYSYMCSFNVAQANDARLTALRRLEGKPILVLIENADGVNYLLGDRKRPMKLSKCDFDSGTKATDRPQFVVEIMGTRPFPQHPYIYTGTIA
jgi:hypothetical protein